MKVVAIIQARMGSTRLPGKVLRTLGDRSVLAHVVGRVRACPLVHEVVVATTTEAADAAIVEETARLSVTCYRGSEEDVLGRYYHAAIEAGSKLIVRVTSDCPLFDPGILTAMLEKFLESVPPVDYMSNTLTRSFPRGLDAEIFSMTALTQAYVEAQSPHQREHVTPYFYENPERFRLGNYQRHGESLGHFRWTLDTMEDWMLLERIFALRPSSTPLLQTNEVLALLRARPELVALNAHVEQKKLTGA